MLKLPVIRLAPLYTNLILVFCLFWWVAMAYFDGTEYNSSHVNGKWITNLNVGAMFLLLYLFAHIRLRLLMLIMVPLSWLGEEIFSGWLQFYDYREGYIPHYIPFGHAIVFAISWIIGYSKPVWSFITRNRNAFLIIYALMFAFVILYFGDTLSAFFGLLFFLALRRKKYNAFYLLMGFVVLYLELAGTWVGCWKWRAERWFFDTVNPPLGAIFIYVGGDILLGRILRKGLGFRRNRKRQRPSST